MHPSVVHPRELRDFFMPQGRKPSPHPSAAEYRNPPARSWSHPVAAATFPDAGATIPDAAPSGPRVAARRSSAPLPARAALPPWSRHQHLRQVATRASCASGGRRSNSGPMRWAAAGAAVGPRSSASGKRSALPGIAVLVLERRQVVRREARTFRKVTEGQPQRLTTGPDFRAQLHAPERDPRMPPR